jgi:hypothetical protein
MLRPHVDHLQRGPDGVGIVRGEAADQGVGVAQRTIRLPKVTLG